MGLPLYKQELDEVIRETCCSCGVVFGVTRYFHDMKVRNKDLFYCPNGHGQSYTKNEADRLREQLEKERQRIEMFRRENQEKERTITSLKGQLTKTKKRVGNGVCPCCNRSFVQLQRHIKTKHPDYLDKEKPNAKETTN